MSLALAKRAVACKDWQWRKGMSVVDDSGARGVVVELGPRWREEDSECGWVFEFGKPPTQRRQPGLTALWGWWPDLTDPCTLGGLLSLVREAWGDPHVYAAPDGDDDPWVCHVRISEGCYGIEAPTEAEALVAALEAAGRSQLS